MNTLKIKNFIIQNKCKILTFLLFIFIIKSFSSGKTIFLEKAEEIVNMPVSIVESSDLFSESKNYVIKQGKNGKDKVVYELDEYGNKQGVKNREVIEEPQEQKELKGTLNFKNYQIDIENTISNYLKNINNKNFNVQDFYTSFSKTNDANTQTNFSDIIKLNGNFILKDTTPIYDVSTSKAMTKTTVSGNFRDEILEKDLSEFNIYSYWNGKKFEIINPEYIYLRSEKLGKDVSGFVEGTLQNKTHYLSLAMNKIILNLPNKMFIQLSAKSTENVLFNKLKISIINKTTKEEVYSGKINYKEISEKSSWSKGIVQGKIGYKTTFWIPIEFQKNDFNLIIDKLMKNGKLELSNFQIKLKPENDLDVNLNYPDYLFDL